MRSLLLPALLLSFYIKTTGLSLEPSSLDSASATQVVTPCNEKNVSTFKSETKLHKLSDYDYNFTLAGWPKNISTPDWKTKISSSTR